jgi:hypothetical protein
MNNNDVKEISNLIPFRTTDRFGVFVANVSENDEITEQERIGSAYMRPGAKMFRLKIWLMPLGQYFIARDRQDPDKYTVLALDEFQTKSGELRTHWNRVGEGRVQGSHIRMKLQLIPDELYLSLFPDDVGEAISEIAS